jgi:hypothetical protein
LSFKLAGEVLAIGPGQSSRRLNLNMWRGGGGGRNKILFFDVKNGYAACAKGAWRAEEIWCALHVLLL